MTASLLVVWRMELARAARTRIVIALSLLTPMAWLVLFGLGFDQGVGLSFGGAGYLAFVAPGIMAMLAMTWALGSGQAVGVEARTGFLREVLAAPVPRATVAAGRALAATTLAVLQALVILGAGVLLGGGAGVGPAGWALAALIVALLAVGFAGLGMAMGLRAPDPQASQALTALLVLPLFFLSGALQPVELLPSWLRPLALLDPLTYAVDALRQATLPAAEPVAPLPLALAGLAAFAALGLAAAARSLRDLR